MPRVPFTHELLGDLKPKDRPYEVLDPSLPGFGVRVLPSGKKVFLVRYPKSGRRERLGVWGPLLLLVDARKMAADRLYQRKPPQTQGVVLEDGSLLLRPGTTLHTQVLRQLLKR